MKQDANLGLVRKSVELLDQLAQDGEMSVAQLAECTGEPRSSIYRLLASLQALDMVEAGSRRGTFRLGFHLMRLGSAVVARFDERRFALPVMEHIHERLGETVFFCVRRELEAVCIERIDGRRVQTLALRLGGSLPLHVGAAPRAIMAFEDRAFWDEYFAQAKLERLTKSTPTSRKRVIELLEETRESGVAVSDEDVTVGVAAIGVPVFDYSGAVRGALSVSGVRPAILGDEEKKIRRLVVEGGEQISRALGGHLASEPIANFG